jgi:hypothetical protein
MISDILGMESDFIFSPSHQPHHEQRVLKKRGIPDHENRYDGPFLGEFAFEKDIIITRVFYLTFDGSQ